jgi:hypothetical protein
MKLINKVIIYLILTVNWEIRRYDMELIMIKSFNLNKSD